MRRKHVVVLSFFCGLLAVLLSETARSDTPKTGKIQGVVRFTGVLPPPQEILTTDGQRIIHNDLVVDARTKGLRDVVTILEDAPAQPKVAKAKPAVIDQREMLFVPRVVAVRHGQAVRFENSDGCNHSVMASSTVAANSFNIFVNGDRSYLHVFEPQKRVIPIGCSLHAWMKAWVYAVPHPWFAVSDQKGSFLIDRVPPGKYTLWLRHPDTGLEERRTVQVLAGKTAEVSVEWQKTSR